jgi:hypothetical protein
MRVPQTASVNTHAGTEPCWTSRQRVLAACAFCRPDRIPRCDDFWSVPQEWLDRLGPAADQRQQVRSFAGFS